MADNPELKDAEEELAEAEKDLQRERLMKRYRTPKSRTRQMNRKIKDAERSRARAEKASTPSAKDKLEASAKTADLYAVILEGLIESGEETTTKGVANAKKKIEEAEAKIKEVQSKVEAGANKRALEHEKKAKQLKREAEQLEKEAENLKTT